MATSSTSLYLRSQNAWIREVRRNAEKREKLRIKIVELGSCSAEFVKIKFREELMPLNSFQKPSRRLCLECHYPPSS